MKHSAMGSIVTGLAAGAVVGTASYMMSNTGKKKTANNLKRNAGKALKAVGSVIENVSYMMK